MKCFSSKKMNNVVRYAANENINILPWFNPIKIIRQLWLNRTLIKRFTWNEVVDRYKGSYLGILWSLLTPLFMLGLYTFVFAVLFGAKWGLPQESRTDFAIVLFAGIITFGIFSEVVNAAPNLVLSRPMFVKKTVFPLEILPVMKLFSALINALFSTVILLAATLFTKHSLSWTILLLPIVWFPLAAFSLGLAYFLASLGVFIRDIGHFIGIAVTMLFFLSPIFFPLKLLLSKLPEYLHIFFKLNPIATVVEDTRSVLIFGLYPNWPWTLLMTAIGLIVFILGFVWFMKSKRAFADVI